MNCESFHKDGRNLGLSRPAVKGFCRPVRAGKLPETRPGPPILGSAMPIHEEMSAELRDAMRQRDRRRLDVIRQVESEVSRAKSEPGFSGEVDDALYARVIAAYVKKMDKAREEFALAGERGRAAVEKLGFEIEYLGRWLASGMDDSAVKEVVRVALMELRVNDPKQAGQVIGHIMKNGPKGLDGSQVSRLVREALGAE